MIMLSIELFSMRPFNIAKLASLNIVFDAAAMLRQVSKCGLDAGDQLAEIVPDMIDCGRKITFSVNL